MDSVAPAISVEHLVCGYDERIILRDVSFNVRAGEIFFVVGGSGCGKSTLLRHLIGLNRPLSGTIRFFGQPFTEADPEERRRMLRSFGVLYQSAALWSSLTVRENVALPLQEHSGLGPSEIDDLVALKLAQVGLTGFAEFYPAELSGGMRKRAGIARALAIDPSIVFFDEPGAGLDPVTAREIDALILQIREDFGTTCVVVSHELDSIFRLGDRLIMLDRAEAGVIAEGAPEELRETSADPRVTAFLRREPRTGPGKSSASPRGGPGR